MRFKRLLLLPCTFLFLCTGAQNTFHRAFQSTNSLYAQSYAGQQTNDGGYILTGTDTVSASQGYDVLLIKTNAGGDTLWTKTYGNTANEYGQCVQQTADSGYVIAGQINTGGNWDCYVVKTNKNGDTLWTKNYGGPGDDEANSIREIAGGGYIISGYTNSFGSYDYYLIKTDASGNVTWAKTYGSPKNEFGYYAQQTSDGGYIMAGVCDSLGKGGYNPFLVKTNSLGDTLWTKVYGTKGIEWIYMVKQTADLGYILCGYSTLDSVAGPNYIYLIKTNNIGDTLWTKYFGGSAAQQALSVVQTSDGGYIVTGATDLGAGGLDAFLIKTDANGIIKHSMVYGGTGDEAGYGAQKTADGGYVLAGYTNSFKIGNVSSAFYLVKTDSTLNTGNCHQNNPVFTVTTAKSFVYHPVVVRTIVTPTVTVMHPVVRRGSLVNDPCATLGLDQRKEQVSGISVYPNPAHGTVTLEVPGIRGSVLSASVLNLIGDEIYYSRLLTGTTPLKLDLSNLSEGVYFIKCSDADRTYLTKFIIAH